MYNEIHPTQIDPIPELQRRQGCFRIPNQQFRPMIVKITPYLPYQIYNDVVIMEIG